MIIIDKIKAILKIDGEHDRVVQQMKLETRVEVRTLTKGIKQINGKLKQRIVSLEISRAAGIKI